MDRVDAPAEQMTPATDAAAAGHQLPQSIDILKIMQSIPHRYPFLLIDKMVEIHAGQSAIGIKNVTVNEPFFQGHFPSHPVMPGVLIVEAMAQTAATLVVMTLGRRSKASWSIS